MGTAPVAYASYVEPAAGPAWLRRYAPLFAVLSVLLLAMIVGLLVGHWVTQSKPTAPGPQVIKVEGLGALGSREHDADLHLGDEHHPGRQREVQHVGQERRRKGSGRSQG